MALLTLATVTNAHYAIAAQVPWSIWAALGLSRLASRLVRRGWSPVRLRRAAFAGFAALGMAYGLGFWLLAPRLDRRGLEGGFYESAARWLPAGTPVTLLYDDWDRNPYDSPFGAFPHDLGVRLFYLRRPAVAVQGRRAGDPQPGEGRACPAPLLALRPSPRETLYVIGRERDRPDLEWLGRVEVLGERAVAATRPDIHDVPGHPGAASGGGDEAEAAPRPQVLNPPASIPREWRRRPAGGILGGTSRVSPSRGASAMTMHRPDHRPGRTKNEALESTTPVRGGLRRPARDSDDDGPGGRPGPPAEGPAGRPARQSGSPFDGKTLDGWKKTDFSHPGEVKVEDGRIVLATGMPMTGITATHKDLPTTNYELAYEATRLSGEDFAAATFPVADSYITLVNGGWGGFVTGLSSLNGMDASENETTRSYRFENKTWYRFRVRVTDDVIRCWVDDKEIVAVEHREKHVGTRVETRSSEPLLRRLGPAAPSATSRSTLTPDDRGGQQDRVSPHLDRRRHPIPCTSSGSPGCTLGFVRATEFNGTPHQLGMMS